MIKEAIDRILEVATPKVIDVEGKKFATSVLVEMPSSKPEAETLVIHTLGGLVDFVTSKFDGDTSKVGAVVTSPEEVKLITTLFGEFRQRETFITTKRYETKGFPFGNFIDVERFIVEMQSRFVQDPVVAQVLKIVGNIKETTVKTVEDDGISQQVTAMAGVARVANVVLPNPVELRPFRTFQEIEQPASLFVVRVRSGTDGGLPTVALFEVDDCNWKVEAVKGIRVFLEDNIGEGFPIFV
jgi:hypothetical protein